MAPPIPIKKIKTSTIVSPKVWADLVGKINAPEPGSPPSKSALIRPEANAKKTMRYMIAATNASLEVLVEIENEDNRMNHESFNTLHINKLAVTERSDSKKNNHWLPGSC